MWIMTAKQGHGQKKCSAPLSEVQTSNCPHHTSQFQDDMTLHAMVVRVTSAGHTSTCTHAIAAPEHSITLCIMHHARNRFEAKLCTQLRLHHPHLCMRRVCCFCFALLPSIADDAITMCVACAEHEVVYAKQLICVGMTQSCVGKSTRSCAATTVVQCWPCSVDAVEYI